MAERKNVNNGDWDAKGDLLVGTASDAFDQLAVGADGKVLTADSGEATGLAWADGFSIVGTPVEGDGIVYDAGAWETVEAAAFHPAVLVAGLYMTSPYGTQSTSSLVTGRTFVTPLPLWKRATFDRISCRLNTAAGTTGTARLGIYDSDASGYPSDLILDAGTVSLLGAAGNREITISQTLDPGLYWLALQPEWTGSTPVVVGIGNLGVTQGIRTATLTSYGNGFSWANTGALLATATAYPTSAVDPISPLVFLRTA
jgi:hypothetical protein